MGYSPGVWYRSSFNCSSFWYSYDTTPSLTYSYAKPSAVSAAAVDLDGGLAIEPTDGLATSLCNVSVLLLRPDLNRKVISGDRECGMWAGLARSRSYGCCCCFCERKNSVREVGREPLSEADSTSEQRQLATCTCTSKYYIEQKKFERKKRQHRKNLKKKSIHLHPSHSYM